MPRLWVGNCDTEYMVSRLDRLSPEFQASSPRVGKRLIWLMRDGDVMITARPMDREFVQYVAKLAKFDPANIEIISANCDILTQEALHRPELLSRLREKVSSEWELHPYLYDRGVTALGRALTLPVDRTHHFQAQGGAEILNSKVAFRALAAGLGISIPEGAPCRTVGDLRRTLMRLLATHPAVMIKKDRGSGGYGNCVVTTQPDLPIAGAESTVYVTGPEDFQEVVAIAGLSGAHSPDGEVVVEAYHPRCTSIFIEICCPREGIDPYVLSTGELRMALDPPVLDGFVMPVGELPGTAYESMTSDALRLAGVAQRLGYTGLVNIDAIVSPSGDVWFNEINARLGGCTHLHRLASSLLGEGWAGSHVLLSRGKIRAPGLRRLLTLLDEHGLAWDAITGQGVVIAVDDTDRTGTIEYVVLAPDLEVAELIEGHLRHALWDGKTTRPHSECMLASHRKV